MGSLAAVRLINFCVSQSRLPSVYTCFCLQTTTFVDFCCVGPPKVATPKTVHFPTLPGLIGKAVEYGPLEYMEGVPPTEPRAKVAPSNLTKYAGVGFTSVGERRIVQGKSTLRPRLVWQ